MTSALDQTNIHTPSRYVDEGYPWEDWDLLRREAPVFWYEREDVEPFWAITRHEDILAVSKRPDVFINGGPRLRLTIKGEVEVLRGGLDDFGLTRGWDPEEPPDFVFMDDPRHRNLRLPSSRSFTPGRMRAMAAHFDELAQKFTAEFVEALDARSRSGGHCDFVMELAAKLPIAAIGEMMGLPPGDWKKIFKWTNAIVGEVLPEDRLPGEGLVEAATRGMNEFRGYLENRIHERREAGCDRGDLFDTIVSGRVEGRPLNDQQLVGYLLLIIAAGNETTRNATSGGVIALIEHPEQRVLLCANPALLTTAIEEILRWTSPVIQFLRTATEDFELRGQKIRQGETIGVFYPSANRDERVFEDPYRFDITRNPNPHLAFGHGAHFCIGANLARAELRAALQALLPVLPRLELAGVPRRIPNLHVSGYATLPVRAAA
jgi:cholest-4-en-3-one 26-monooxygenase